MDVAIELDDVIEEEELPSKTYTLNFNNKRIVGMCDGEEALKQAIHKSLITARGEFEIAYSDEYGSDIENTMIGDEVSQDFLETIIPELIKEALLEDDRIYDVIDFEIYFKSDSMFVSFNVDCEFGDLDIEEVI